MSRKKAKDPNKQFKQNPFKELRGFCVSESQQKNAANNRKSPKASQPEAPQKGARPEDEDLDFAREMERLGVSGGTLADDEEVFSPSETADLPAQGPPQSEEELFLDALGEMDAVFTDGQPEPEPESQASPRRMKLLRQGRLAPEDRLDLHGLNREEARSRVRFFLENSLYHGRRTVLIITGRGKGSASGPVLRTDLEKYLSFEAKAWVSEWARAPRQYGGEGALVVFLKTKKP